MAKAAAKTSAINEEKKTRAPRAKSSSNSNNIEKVSTEALEKLRALGIEEQLQRDLQWCLGSFRSDKNPIGLQETAKKALMVFKNEKEKKTKGVTASLINDLEKIVKDMD